MSKDNVNTFEMLRELLLATRELAIEQDNLINYDQTKKMRITKVIDQNNYLVQYNNKNYRAFSRFQHKLGDVVYVTICCGNMNNLIIN